MSGFYYEDDSKDSHDMNEKGCIHIYTGNGKGKTTAAIGLALRASGAGLKCCFIQFLKGGNYAEHGMLDRIENITLKRFGRDCLIYGQAKKEDYEEAQKGLVAVSDACFGGEFDVVIADELNVALKLGLLNEEDILELMNKKKSNVELVLTGRGATINMIKKADLVTDMKEIKHYYQNGRQAKKGIEY